MLHTKYVTWWPKLLNIQYITEIWIYYKCMCCKKLPLVVNIVRLRYFLISQHLPLPLCTPCMEAHLPCSANFPAYSIDFLFLLWAVCCFFMYLYIFFTQLNLVLWVSSNCTSLPSISYRIGGGSYLLAKRLLHTRIRTTV